MSKTELAEKILAILKTLPKERIKHYASFKDTEIARFLNPDFIYGTDKRDLQLQYVALRDLVNDKYKNYYKLSDKLLKPKGNPNYYERIMSEINGEKKENWTSALRTVVFGK